MNRKKTNKKQTNKKQKLILSEQEENNAHEMQKMLRARAARAMFKNGDLSYHRLELNQIGGLFNALSAGLMSYREIAQGLGWPLALSDEEYEGMLCENAVWADLRRQEASGELRMEVKVNGQKVIISKCPEMSDESIKRFFVASLMRDMRSTEHSRRALGIKYMFGYLKDLAGGEKETNKEFVVRPPQSGLLANPKSGEDHEVFEEPVAQKKEYWQKPIDGYQIEE